MSRHMKIRGKYILGKECFIKNNLCYVPVGISKYAICDANMFDIVNKYNWHIKDKQNIYACTNIKKESGKGYRNLYLHHLILPKKENFTIDHINRDTLDNTFANLRYLEFKFNTYNSNKHKNNKSGYLGVSFYKKQKKYISAICVDDKDIHLANRRSKNIAAKIRDLASLFFFKEYAVLNFPNNKEEYLSYLKNVNNLSDLRSIIKSKYIDESKEVKDLSNN